MARALSLGGVGACGRMRARTAAHPPVCMASLKSLLSCLRSIQGPATATSPPALRHVTSALRTAFFRG